MKRKRFKVIGTWDLGQETEKNYWKIWDNKLQTETIEIVGNTKKEANKEAEKLNELDKLGQEEKINQLYGFFGQE